MKIKKMIRQVLLGAMFALPFMAILLLLEKIWIRFSGVSKKIGTWLGDDTLLGSYTETIFFLVFFIFCFYLIGSIANYGLSAKIHRGIEKGFLEYIPGYLVYKNKMAQALDTTSGERKPVYFINELEKKPGILIEQSEEEALLFIPSIPDTNSGEIVIAPLHAIEFINMPVAKFMSLLQLTGKGLLKKENSLSS